MAAAAPGSPPRLGVPSPAPGAAPLFAQPGPLANLEDIDARVQYRERPDAEREEAMWYLPDAVDALAEPTPVRLRSVHSKQASVIRFCNKSARAVRALWVDFDGHEVVYSVIEPGTTRLYRTYATHPWIVRELTTGARMMLSGAAAVVGMTEEQTVDITDPPELCWGLDTHRCFPADFKTAAQQLLLAHHRLSTPVAAEPFEPCSTPKSLVVASPPCSPLRPATAGPAAALTTTTRLQLSMPQTQLSIAITTDAPAADCCGSAVPDSGACGVLVSPLSPRRTINITVNATGSSLGVNIESTTESSVVLADAPSRSPADQMLPSPPLPPPSPASRGRRAIMSGIRNSLTGIKGLMSPGLSASARASRSPPALVGGEVARSQSLGFELRLDSAPALDTCGAAGITDLGALPHHLVVRIVELAAPKQWQGVHMPRVGRPDVRPTLLACPPDTKTQREEEAEAAAAAAAQQMPQPGLAHAQAQQHGGGAVQPLNAAVAALNAFIQQGWHGVWGPLGQGAAPADDMPALGDEEDDAML